MNLQETIKNYYWITAGGDRLKLTEMTTLHLGNTLKMLWNHVCYRLGGQKVALSNTYQRFTEMSRDEPAKILDLMLILRHVIDRRSDVYSLDPWYPQIVVQLADGRPKKRHEQLLNGAQTRFEPICEFYKSYRDRCSHDHLDFFEDEVFRPKQPNRTYPKWELKL
jgi:hypothetical protein